MIILNFNFKNDKFITLSSRGSGMVLDQARPWDKWGRVNFRPQNFWDKDRRSNFRFLVRTSAQSLAQNQPQTNSDSILQPIPKSGLQKTWLKSLSQTSMNYPNSQSLFRIMTQTKIEIRVRNLMWPKWDINEAVR